MDEIPTPPPIDDLVCHLEEAARDEARACLDEVQSAPVDDRKDAVRALRTLAEDRPGILAPVCAALAPFLGDDERSVRLSTAKLFVTLAAATPDAVVPVVPPLAARLADGDEFYYVRARAAEALGYVALDHPEAVDSPEILADLRVGLSFDEPEVKEKLAKALGYVALGDPGRLRHHVSTLADRLDDENDLVRYHLCSTLVAVGCEYPDRLTAARGALLERVDDENTYVRARAIEALGLLGRADDADVALPDSLRRGDEGDEASFVADRIRFALGSNSESVAAGEPPDEIGTLGGVRATTEGAVDAITSPDSDGECPHCGLALPDDGPPMCPRCGAPH